MDDMDNSLKNLCFIKYAFYIIYFFLYYMLNYICFSYFYQLLEVFGSGTACVVCPVGSITYMGKTLTIPTDSSPSPLYKRLLSTLHSIQVWLSYDYWLLNETYFLLSMNVKIYISLLLVEYSVLNWYFRILWGMKNCMYMCFVMKNHY